MSNPLFHLRGAAYVGLAVASIAAVHGEEMAPESGIWIRGGGVLRSGIGVDFRNTTVPTPVGAGIFQNGYVLPSVSTNSPYTWNWGYQKSSQIVEDTLNLERWDKVPRVGDLSGKVGTAFGGDLRAGIEVTRFMVGRREVKFGLEGGYGYSTVSARAGGSAAGTGTHTTATYSFQPGDEQTIIPPLPPYSGTFAGPGPLIPRAPISGPTTTPVTGTSTLDMRLNAHLHILKAGVYFEVPVARRLTAGVSFGYCSVLPDAQLTIDESFSYDSSAGGHHLVRRSDWRPGGYFELRAQYDITKRLGVYVGGQYEFNQNSTFGGFGREATLKLGGVYGGTLGLRWGF